MQTPRARLRLWLAEIGLTQAALAVALECHSTFVNHLITGRKTPGLAIAAAIERLSGGWRLGPIRAVEWTHAPERPAVRGPVKGPIARGPVAARPRSRRRAEARAS